MALADYCPFSAHPSGYRGKVRAIPSPNTMSGKGGSNQVSDKVGRGGVSSGKLSGNMLPPYIKRNTSKNFISAK